MWAAGRITARLAKGSRPDEARSTCSGYTKTEKDISARGGSSYREDYASGSGHGSKYEGSTQVEVKVSVDDGETWTRRRINMGGELDDSGLEAGEIVQLQEEKYRVLVGDNGLRIEPMRKPSGAKKRSRRR